MRTTAQRFGRLETATISDALDRLGIKGQCYGLSPRSGEQQLTGRAFTVRYGPAGTPAGTVGDYIDEVATGAIVVLDNGGRDDGTVWGDILTEVAHAKGIAGTVVNGVTRDIALARQLGYPIFSRGNWMRTGKDRVQVEGVECVVEIGGIRVMPGDLLRGDSDGVLVIPQAQEDRILQIAEEIHRAEEAIRAAVRSGSSLKEARVRAGYHSLQTRTK
jgi:4-hydroxy-4-methyl-2-oxoglutarate aldolase